MKKVIIGMCFIVGSTIVCRADMPPCTGDRHEYCTPITDPPAGKCNDGSACTCPSKCPDGQDCHCDASVTTSTTTTTTLPSTAECTCPPVECVCDGNAPTVTVVMPCPVAPRYILCRAVKKSKRHPNGLKCKAPSHPHAVWVPETDSALGAF